MKHSAGDLDYWVAGPEDEPVVRSILARVATGGKIQLSFQREPDAFGGSFGAAAHDFILARSRSSGEYVGVCERVVREVFVNGELRRLPYLAGLRVVPGFRHRMLVLRGGFEAVRRLLGSPEDLPWSLTSIMSDNAAARRLLGANLRGMPRYEPLGEMSTFAFQAQGMVESEHARESDLPQIAALLQGNSALQFASAWTLPALRGAMESGWLWPRDFLIVKRGGIRAVAALWDQSAYRQVVVAGYSPWLRRTRPMINLAARLLRLPHLPAPGGNLRAAYLSHLAWDDASPEDLFTLIAAARAEARRRGIEVLLFGLVADHPLADRIRALPRQREFRSQLYVVRWPDDAAPTLDAGRRLAPELALL